MNSIAEAMRLARAKVEQAIKARGDKLSYYAEEDIIKAAEMVVEQEAKQREQGK